MTFAHLPPIDLEAVLDYCPRVRYHSSLCNHLLVGVAEL